VGVRGRQSALVVVVLVLAAALSGCTKAVGDATDRLYLELQAYPGVDGGFSTSNEDTLFDDPLSAISLDLADDTTADQLDDIVTAWRFGVDGIDARWSLNMSRSGGEGQGYDDFSVVGVRSVADLTAMVRFWHRTGLVTDSASVSLYDYGDVDGGFIRLEYPAQPSAALHEIIRPLAAEALELPGLFQWSVEAPIPGGEVRLAGENMFADDHMLDVLAAIAALPDASVGPVVYNASARAAGFGPVVQPRMWLEIGFAMPTFEQYESDDVPDVDEAAALMVAGAEWGFAQRMADVVAHDEAAVVLDFTYGGQGVAHLDPFQCTTPASEEIYGPLNDDLWQYWMRDGAVTPDGSTAGECLSY
jgi:hypothetical protein